MAQAKGKGRYMYFNKGKRPQYYTRSRKNDELAVKLTCLPEHVDKLAYIKQDELQRIGLGIPASEFVNGKRMFTKMPSSCTIAHLREKIRDLFPRLRKFSITRCDKDRNLVAISATNLQDLKKEISKGRFLFILPDGPLKPLTCPTCGCVVEFLDECLVCHSESDSLSNKPSPPESTSNKPSHAESPSSKPSRADSPSNKSSQAESPLSKPSQAESTSNKSSKAETLPKVQPLEKKTDDRNQTVRKIISSFKPDNISFVRFEQTDVYGVARSKTIPVHHFRAKAVNGLNFYLGHLGYDPQAGFIEDSAYTAASGQCDAICFPDFSTYHVLPWSKRTARILIEPTYKGKLVEAHPRVVARRQLDKLKEMGYSLLSAHEHEFYLVDKETRKTIDDAVNIRSTIRLAAFEDIIYTFLDGLDGAGINVECAETEYGPGQIEISYRPAFGIRAADNAHTYRTGIKEMAIKNGYMATFMSKPFPDRSGSACHFCHSLWDVEGKTPLLYDADSPTGLTEIGQHWIAGLLEHIAAIALLVGPTINCLKRYLPNSFAPSNATWGIDNRTCAVRVKLNGQKGTYIENRLGASGCNPYIALAATVAAGMDGISKKLPLPPCVKETDNAYNPEHIPAGTANVPTNMKDAMEALRADDVITAALGEEFIECFLAAKRHEIILQEKNEDNWEHNLFFEYL